MNSSSGGGALETVSAAFYTSVLPLVAVLGILGNGAVLAVVNNSYALARVPAHRYLSGLAAASSLYLLIMLLMWLEHFSQFRIYARSLAGCKVLTWLGHACDFGSAWLAGALAFDRLGALYFRRPSRLTPLLTRQTAARATIVIVGIALVWSSWSLFLAELVPVGPRNGTFRCSFAFDYYDTFRVFLFMDTFVVIAFPLLVISAVNVAVAFNFHRYLQIQGTASSVRFSESTSDAPIRRSTGFQRARRAVRPAELRLSRTLLLLTTAFLLLNFPSYALRLLDILQIWTPTAETAWIPFMALLLYYLHHAFLFILYITLSPKVRREIPPTLARLVECGWLVPGGVAGREGDWERGIEPLLVQTASTTVLLVRRSL